MKVPPGGEMIGKSTVEGMLMLKTAEATALSAQHSRKARALIVVVEVIVMAPV